MSALVSVLVLFCSCLDTTVSIRLKANGTVRTVLVYSMSQDFAGFGRSFGAEEPWPLPLSERSFRQREFLYPETGLVSYKSRTRNSKTILTVVLESESISDLGEYLGVDLDVTGNRQSGSLTLSFPDTEAWSSYSPKIQNMLNTAVSESTVTVELRPPGKPRETSQGDISGKTARLSLPLTELLESRPGNWVVEW